MCQLFVKLSRILPLMQTLSLPAVMILAGLAALPAHAQSTYHVCATTGDDGNDGLGWATPKQTIQAAVNAASGGDTVLVTNGVHTNGGATAAGMLLTNRVAVTKPLTVRSVNGPAVTEIRGRWHDPDDPANKVGFNAVRCVYLTNGAALIGFTLSGGSTHASDGAANDQYCSGVRGGSRVGCVVSNCVIAGNFGVQYLGAFNVALVDCLVASNYASGNGGGGRYVNAYNCRIEANNGQGGTGPGGFYQSYLENCTLAYNIARMAGGAAYACELRNCLVYGNSAQTGGGTAYCTNINCTIIGNEGTNSVGGAFSGYLSNCIVYYNKSALYAATRDNYYQVLEINQSCLTPLPAAGVGNMTNEPAFVQVGANYGTNHIAGNYRLLPVSPCVNAGTNQAWMAGALDRDGHARIDRFSGKVDMGCFEYLSRGAFFTCY